MAQVRVPVEVDVTYVNKTWFSYKNPKHIKQYVIGFFQRHGQAIIKVLPDNKPETIKEFVLRHTTKGCILYAEKDLLPTEIKELYELHEFEIPGSDIHVNNVMNMWKSLKREIKRVHVQVSTKHLQLYCDEVMFRINTKDMEPMDRFNFLLSNCVVKDRKTSYKNLIK